MNVELIQDLEQQKIILKEINSILKRQNQAIQNKIVSNSSHGLKIENKKIMHVTIAIIAVSTLSLFAVYSQYENQLLTPKLSGATSSYVIQNLQGDTVNTWRSEEHTSELQSQFHLVC